MKNLFNISYDTVTKDDSNKEVRGNTIKVHNQGNTIVLVNKDTLLPDDQMIITAPVGGTMLVRLQIEFLVAYPLTNPLSTYPQLQLGNRVHISEIKQIGVDG